MANRKFNVAQETIPIYRRLTSKFVGMILLFTLCPLIFLYFFSVNIASEALLASLRNDLQEKSFLVGADIDRFFSQRERDVRILSQADVLEQDNINKIIKYISEIINETPFLDDIDVIDNDGIIIASTGEQNEIGKHVLSLFPSLKPLFNDIRMAKQGQVFVSGILNLDSGPGLAFLTPITDDSNTIIIGSLLVEINLGPVKKIVADFDERVIGDKYVYLVDNAGRVIISADPNVSLLSPFPDLAVRPELLKIFSRQGEVGNIVYDDASGDPVMAGYADMAEFGVNKAMDWSIIAVAPLSEILSPVDQIKETLLITTVFVSLLAMFFMNLASRRVVVSILECGDVAEKIAKGDRYVMIKNTGMDEIGYLGRSINLINVNFKTVEEQLHQAQRMEAIGQLTGGIAHDFNNLLSTMIGNAEALEILSGKQGHMNKHIEAIIEAIDRGSSLTDRLLSFSRQQTLSPVAVAIPDLINGLEDMLQRTLGETINLKHQVGSDIWLATIDQHQFENALINLTLNARDAMPSGGFLTIDTANVTVVEHDANQNEEVKPGDYVTVSVSDTGTGMPANVLEKVFEPFFTTKDFGEGSGLGLSMVYGFAKQSGGNVTISSDVDYGTSVKLYLPRSRGAARQTVVKLDTSDPASGSERILIIEDDPSVRKTSEFILRNQGYDIVSAENRNEAIKLFKQHKSFDLLFTDLVLPGGRNGVEVAEEILLLQPDIKVLFTTGYAKNAVFRNEDLKHSETLLNKPYRRKELLEKVRAKLDEEGD